MSEIGWAGQLQVLIVPGAANASGIFLLGPFAASSIPDELTESARTDGAEFFRTWWSIGVPMLMAGAFASVLPLIGVLLTGSRHFVATIAAGALKG